MTEQPALRLLKGHTVHQRSVPFTHRFKYGLGLIDIDIDRLDAARKTSPLFNIDATGLFSFNRRDHGARSDADLRPWAEAEFARAGIDMTKGTIRLVTFPRHAFYKFAPISLWLGQAEDGTLRGILYEVNNTFGETHVYAAATPEGSRHQHATDKVFHVSPFFDVSGAYQFTLKWTDKGLNLVVATMKNDQQTHVATISAKAFPATTAGFLSLAFRKPFSSLGVTAAIHWQALKLWIKGAKYHSKPKQSSVRTTIATPRSAAAKTAPVGETIA
ncbi:MAG: DUF1365 domain-containing protein [Pseudomonadota bacterium]